MRATLRTLHALVVFTAVLTMTAVVLAMHTPDPVQTSDNQLTLPETFAVHAVSAIETCHLTASCEMPPLLGNGILTSADDLLRKSAFSERVDNRTSITVEAQLPPPRA